MCVQVRFAKPLQTRVSTYSLSNGFKASVSGAHYRIYDVCETDDAVMSVISIYRLELIKGLEKFGLRFRYYGNYMF
jgi:hypothetical protein